MIAVDARGPIERLGYQARQLRLDGALYVNAARRLSLIYSIGVEQDGRPWLHISVAGRGRLPTWDELVDAKEALVGVDVDAYQVIPRRSRYVNTCTTALHLFICLDGSTPLPDFTRGSGQI